MLPLVQALLIERFGLAFHRETRDLPVYHLITAKNGNKPREHVQGNCRMPDEPNIPPDPNNVFANLNCGNVLYLPPAWLLGGMVRISSQGTGGESFAGRQSLSKTFVEILSTPLGRMVIDQTGLRGTYDINLRWSAEGSDADGTPGPSLSTALQEQLGLRLESARGPVEVLVIERVSKPSEN